MGSDPKTLKALIESQLDEASAVRITPTYVYSFKYKDGVQAKGITPVRIKHANVWKHVDDLVDPPPGSPLINTVIGTIPKYYSKASDLVLKDKTAKLADVMTPDGPLAAEEGELQVDLTKLQDTLMSFGFNDPAKKAALLNSPKLNAELSDKFGLDWKQSAVDAGFDIAGVKKTPPVVFQVAEDLNYPVNSEQFKILRYLLAKPADSADALDLLTDNVYKGDMDAAYSALEAVLNAVEQLAQSKPYIKHDIVDLDDGSETIVVTFVPSKLPKKAATAAKPQTTSQAPVVVPVQSSPPAPVAVAPTPTPAPAPVAAPPTFDMGKVAVAGFDKVKSLKLDPNVQVSLGTLLPSGSVKAYDAYAAYGLLSQKIESNSASGSNPLFTQTTVKASDLMPEFSASKALELFQALKDAYLIKTAGTDKAYLLGQDADVTGYDLKVPQQIVDDPVLYKKIVAAIPAEQFAQAVRIMQDIEAGSADYTETITRIKKSPDYAQAATILLMLYPYIHAPIYDDKGDLAGPPFEFHGWKDPDAKPTPDAVKTAAPVSSTPAPAVDPDTTTPVAASLYDFDDTVFAPAYKDMLAAALPADSATKKFLDGFAPFSGKHGHARLLLTRLISYAPIATGIHSHLTDTVYPELIAPLEDALLKDGYLTPEMQPSIKFQKLAMAAGVNINPAAVLPSSAATTSAPAPVVAPSPVVAPPPAPPTPTIAVKGKGMLALAPIPASGLTNLGDAKAQFGGYHAKNLYADASGNKFLGKPGTAMSVQAGTVYANVAAQILGPENVVPVRPLSPSESIQPIIPNVKIGLDKVTDLKTLTVDQLKSLLKERVTDWLMSNHDAKPANFLITTDGQLVGIDKEQAFKALGQDSLATDYKPNPTKQLYSTIFDMYANNEIDLPIEAIEEAIESVEALSDADYKKLLQPYIDTLPQSEQQKKMDLALDRKNTIRESFESLLTDLMKKRGTLAKGKFTFKKKKKKKLKDYGPVPVDATGAAVPPVAAMGSVLSPPALPPVSSLIDQGPAVGIGGAGTKNFMLDATGKKYLLKFATAKGGSNPEPHKVSAQTLFSAVSAIVRPGKSVPVGDAGLYQGKPVTLQPWLGDNLPTLEGVAPDSLTPSEKLDVAEEHLLDWMLSQHDTHGGNLLKTPNGIVSIDKEQGFKYLFGFQGTKPDYLGTDYKPNTAIYGEAEPYYNQFWRDYRDGKLDFDPAKMAAAIERIESIPDSDYLKALQPYAANAPWNNDGVKVSAFFDKAMERKKNIRKDFEAFITPLYQKRTGSTDTFKFPPKTTVVGVAPAASPPLPAEKKATAIAGQPLAPKTLPETRVAANGSTVVQQSPSPASKGKIGAINPKMLKGGPQQKPVAPKPPPTPAGFPAPPPGKMWEVGSLSKFITGANVMKEKTPKDANDQPIPDAPNVLLKFYGKTAQDIQSLLDKAGVKTLDTLDPKTGAQQAGIVVKGANAIAVVNKAEWEAVKATNPAIGTLVDIPPPPAPTPGLTLTAIPEAGQLSNPLALVGLDTLEAIQDSKGIGYGQAFVTDAGDLELMNLQVQRCEDKSGVFYRVNFKVKAEQRTALGLGSGGTPSTYRFNQSDYDGDKDAWVQDTISLQGFDFAANMWSDGKSTVHAGKDLKGVPYAARNWVIADIRLQPGENVKDGLRRVLSLVSPKLAKAVETPPSEEAIQTLKLSSLLWSFAPQVSDQMTGNARNATTLKAALVTAYRANPLRCGANNADEAEAQLEKDIQSIRLEQTANGQVSPVLPGRFRRIGKGVAGYLKKNVKVLAYSTAKNVDAVVDQILGSSISPMQRLLQGTAMSSTSAEQDFRTGGGAGVFTNARNETNFSNFSHWGGGDFQMMYDPSELDRLDCHVHVGDSYGTTDPDQPTFGKEWQKRQPLEDLGSAAQEVVLRQGVSSRKLLRAVTTDATFAAAVIQKLKARGITEINGMTPEELILVVPDDQKKVSALYPAILQPAGY